MDKNEALALIKELAGMEHCGEVLKTAANAYLASVGGDREEAAKDALISKLDENVNTIDESLAFFESEVGVKFFGAEKAAEIAGSFRAAKEAGERYCLCPACQAGYKIYDFLVEM